MTILLMPSLSCNLRCTYCFERPVWESEVARLRCNVDAITSVLEKLVMKYGRGSVCIHGGEPLTLPISELEYLFNYIRGRGLSPSIQTNGTMITERHIELFKKYNVHVGVSVDGPPEIARLRGGDVVLLRQANDAIARMREKGVSVGVLCVLSKVNATGEALDKLCNWARWLNSIGVSGRFLTMKDFFGISEEFELTSDEMADAWEKLYYALESIGAADNWSPFHDLILSLQGRRKDAVCWLNECDPFCTQACHVILPDGTETICDRAFFMGLLLRPESSMNIRQQMLANSDCRGCRWFPDYCVGGCPLDGEGGDWRNKSKWCKAIDRMLTILSKRHPPTKPTCTGYSPTHGDIPHGDFTDHSDR